LFSIALTVKVPMQGLIVACRIDKQIPVQSRPLVTAVIQKNRFIYLHLLNTIAFAPILDLRYRPHSIDALGFKVALDIAELSEWTG